MEKSRHHAPASGVQTQEVGGSGHRHDSLHPAGDIVVAALAFEIVVVAKAGQQRHVRPR